VKKEKRLPNKLGNYISSLIFNCIFLFIANKLPDWNLAFLTPEYAKVLLAINISLGVQASGNLMLIMYRPLTLHYITQVIINFLGFYAAYMLFTVFPFDFTASTGVIGKIIQNIPLRLILKIIFGIGMAGSIISGITNLVKFIVNIVRSE